MSHEQNVECMERFSAIETNQGNVAEKLDEMQTDIKAIRNSIGGNGQMGLSARVLLVEQKLGELDRRSSRFWKVLGGIGVTIAAVATAGMFILALL